MSKLFVYGSLAPGKANAHILEPISGTWEKAYVKGKLYEEGWGADLGFPGIRLEESGEKIWGWVFTSDALEAQWKQLDEFEGAAYQRVKTPVFAEGETLLGEAFLYVLV